MNPKKELLWSLWVGYSGIVGAIWEFPKLGDPDGVP